MLLAVIADDFTGSVDTGVQFIKAGFPTIIFPSAETYNANQAHRADVIVINAESRHLPAGQAFFIVEKLTRQLAQSGCKLLYKKTDSILRGNIGAELAAVAAGSQCDQLVFAPAFPDNQRYTIGGIQYYKDTPVHLSVLGNDPFEPLTTSNVVELIHQQSTLPVYCEKNASSLHSKGISVIDAVNNSELRSIAQLVLEKGVHIFAGCAGFSNALAHVLAQTSTASKVIPKLSLPNSIFIVSGSISPVTLSQLQHCKEAGYQVFIPSPNQKIDSSQIDGETFCAALYRARENHLQNPHTLLASAECDNDVKAVSQYASQQAISLTQTRKRICHFLAAFCSKLLESIPPCVLVVFGGDTLYAIAQETMVESLSPVAEIVPGVVLSRATIGRKEQIIISKSGGFGSDEVIQQIEEYCSKYSE